MARKMAVLLYGGAAYVMFVGVFLYAVGFVANAFVPKGIDDGEVLPLGWALAANAALLGVFAVQHSVMARPGFKRWWTRVIPPHLERSTYVLFANVAMAWMLWQWRPLPTEIWSVQAEWARMVLWGLYASGWGVALLSTFLIDHFELFGLKQVWAGAHGRAIQPTHFRQPLLYRFVRHPLMSGFMIAFWAAPDMSAGRLLFALGATGYILVAVRLEERDLRALLGRTYERYMQAVPRFIPRLGRRNAPVAESPRPSTAGTPRLEG